VKQNGKRRPGFQKPREKQLFNKSTKREGALKPTLQPPLSGHRVVLVSIVPKHGFSQNGNLMKRELENKNKKTFLSQGSKVSIQRFPDALRQALGLTLCSSTVVLHGTNNLNLASWTAELGQAR